MLRRLRSAACRPTASRGDGKTERGFEEAAFGYGFQICRDVLFSIVGMNELRPVVSSYLRLVNAEGNCRYSRLTNSWPSGPFIHMRVRIVF